jgi:hypothetical protein
MQEKDEESSILENEINVQYFESKIKQMINNSQPISIKEKG